MNRHWGMPLWTHAHVQSKPEAQAKLYDWAREGYLVAHLDSSADLDWYDLLGDTRYTG